MITLYKKSALRETTVEIDPKKKHFWAKQQFNVGSTKHTGGLVRDLRDFVREKLANGFKVIGG